MGEQSVSAKGNRAEGFFNKARSAILFSTALLLLLGAYYFFFVQRKHSYLMGRNFRFLATIGTQLEFSLASHARRIQSLTLQKDLAGTLKDEGLREEFAPGFTDVRVDEPWKGVPFDRPSMALQTTPEDNWLHVFYPLGEEQQQQQGKDGKKEVIHGWITLKQIADPLFRSRRAFDAVLLANDEGEVIYHQGARDLSVKRLNHLLDKSSVFATRREKETRNIKELISSSSDSYLVELNGREYRLFIEPVSLPLSVGVDKNGETIVRPSQTWLICGLVPKKDFVYKSLAVSSALLSFSLGLLLLALLSWPFLKLKLLGETQRVGIFDVLLVGLCSLLGVSIATLFVLDLRVYGALKEESERQLETLAQSIESNTRNEIQSAYEVLTNLEREAIAKVSEVQGDPADKNFKGFEQKGLRQVFSQAFVNYPLAQTFTLAARNAKPLYKGSVNERVPSLIPIRDRAYFKRALENDVWDLRNLAESPSTAMALRPRQSFFVESIVGWTMGGRFAVLSKPFDETSASEGKTNDKKRPAVTTLTIPMISLIDPVLPPAFKFAIIDNEDENGKVLFHSDAERNLTEDFLAETDYDRRLRSAIFARRVETMRIRYWGEDYLASVKPVQGLPWTVVALRDLKVLRAVNVDWISTTLLFLFLYCGSLAALLVLVAISRPSYRAEWIWPDPGRIEDYVGLGISYLLTLVGFLIAVRDLRGSAELLAVSVLIPALALLMAYSRLRQRKSPGRRRSTLITGLFILAGLAVALYMAPSEIGAGRLPSAIAFLLVLSAFFLTIKAIPFYMNGIIPFAGSRADAGSDRRSIISAYCFCGTLLLLLMGVLPTIGFFEVAHRTHSESFVKHGQLKLAMEMKKRYLRAQKAIAKVGWQGGKDCLRQERLALAGDPIPECASAQTHKGVMMKRGLDIYAGSFFGTTVDLPPVEPSQDKTSALCQCGKKGGAEPDILPEFLEDFLPRASEHSAEMRELLHARSSDCSWHWRYGKNGSLILHSSDYPDDPDDQVPEIHLESNLKKEAQARHSVQHAGVFASGWFLALGDIGPKDVFVAVFSVLALLGVIALLVLLIRFISRRIFLIDLLEPLWAEQDETGPSTTGRNLFLVSKGKQWKEEVKKNRFYWFHMRDLEDPDKGWPAIRPDLMDKHERVILVEGFEERIWDRDFNKKKLEFLENLVAMKDRTVIVISSISPARLLSRDAKNGHGQPISSATVRRWKELLSSFTISEEDLRMKPADAKKHVASALGEVLQSAKDQPPVTKISSEAGSVLWEEAGDTPHLRAIARELENQVHGLSREQILEELGERAEGYYQTLWESCSLEEELVLEHLAEEGLVNEKSRRLIRRLMARGLVRRKPHFRLMNETFRRFVISSACRREVLGLEREAGPSAWDKLRGPFFFGLAASITFFFVTQEALLDGVVASLTGLTAGLPAVVKAFDWFGGDRPRLPRFGSSK